MTAAVSTRAPRFFAAAGLALLLTLSLGACAGQPQSGYKAEINDPIEPVNRAIFAFNNVFDRFLFEPVAKIYDAVFPGFVKDGVQNFMRNLRSPIIVANNLLQGDFGDAGVATARFVINSTVGVAGLVDVASTQGFNYEEEDFGQTLGVWGVGNGMYIVLPILGPSSLRDAGGKVADLAFDPLFIWSNNTHNDWVYYTRAGVEAIDNRARAIKAIDDLRKNSLDYYAAVRSAYGQRRAALVRDDGRHQNGAVVAMPDYDEEY
jgi:phospholipid-binding lipoprotein MlaA